MRRPPHAAIATVITAAAFVGWTALVVTGVTRPLDEAAAVTVVAPRSPLAQIAEAVAVDTWPGVLGGVLALLAMWAFARRLRRLSVAIVVAGLLAWLGYEAAKLLVHRARPVPLQPDLITSGGLAYPSGHLALITATAIMVIATVTLSRRHSTTLLVVRAAMIAAILLVGLDRWLLRAHWLSDIVGGAIWGACACSLALLVTRLHVLEESIIPPAPRFADEGRRAAVIFNPAKVGDVATFRRRVSYELAEQGWARPVWLETTEDDPGHAMTRAAVDAKVDLVLASGGDGTVRIVCAGLAGTGIPLALLPAGTTNLLARNLGIPLDEADAMHQVFTHEPRTIDLIRTVPDGDEERSTMFAVIGGIGIDASTFANTNEDLKKAIGHAAYFVAAAQQIHESDGALLSGRLLVDDEEPVEFTASLVAVGNVGSIQGGLEVVPGALPDDGLLNVVIAQPDGVREWARLVGDVLARSDSHAHTQQFTGKRARVELDEPAEYEMDGDAQGAARTLEFAIVPGALRIVAAEEAR